MEVDGQLHFPAILPSQKVFDNNLLGSRMGPTAGVNAVEKPFSKVQNRTLIP
jgi:hypothetical protein